VKQSNVRLVALGLGLIALLAGARLRAEEEAADSAAHDQKMEIEALKEAVEGLTAKTEYLDKFHMEGFTDLRYDELRTHYAPIGAAYVSDGTGVGGMYDRRAEIKIFGKLGSVTSYSLGFDFAELKLKDVGIEVADLPMIPFTDLAPEWVFQFKVGQYRQPFGIVPQTSSSKINMVERPIIFGGQSLGNPLKLSGKMVGERVMGVFVNHKKKLVENILSWTVQGAIANDATEDQAAGQNKVIDDVGNTTVATIAQPKDFNKQFYDQDFSYQARLALGLDFMSLFLPEKSANTLGASISHDSNNTKRWLQSDPLFIGMIDTFGFDWLTELANKMVIIQAEFVRQNTASTTGGPGAYQGQLKINEGYYVDVLFDMLPLICTPTKGDALQLIARIEQYRTPNTFGTALTNPNFNGMNTLDGLGFGLRWSYLGGKNSTSINYFVQANNSQLSGYAEKNAAAGFTNFNVGDVPSGLFVIQQQMAFE
jgi:hypothetical protein